MQSILVPVRPSGQRCALATASFIPLARPRPILLHGAHCLFDICQSFPVFGAQTLVDISLPQNKTAINLIRSHRVMYLRSIASQSRSLLLQDAGPTLNSCGVLLSDESGEFAQPHREITVPSNGAHSPTVSPGGFTASHFLIADHSKSKRTPERDETEGERETDRRLAGQ